jgi:hypothetical protein
MRIDSAVITGSFSVNGDTFNDLGSYSTTGSNAFTGSQNITGSLVVSGSFNLTESASAFQIQGNGFGQTYLQSPNGAIVLNPGYGGVEITGVNNRFSATDAYITNLYASNGVVSGSSQIVGILSPLNSYTQSNDTTNTTQNSRLTSLESITGSLATTGSNTFIGTQTITGSLFVSSNLIVQGTSSLQNITASAVSIGTNIVNLNTANPAIRYAGLSIGDSGSVGGSGSFLYDSVQDEMIFVHRGASTVVTSSVTLMGPQTFDNVGNETYPTLNIVQKGTGNEHLVDSCIFDNGTTTCIKNNLIGTNSITANGGLIVAGSPTGYPLGELQFNTTTNNSYSGISTLGTGTTTLYFDHRGTGNAGNFVFRNGTDAASTLLTIAGNSNATFNGNISVNTTNSGVQLQVQTASCSAIRIRSCTVGGCAPVLNFFHDGNDEFTIRGGSGLSFLASGVTQRMFIGTNVNISTSTTISQKLSVSTSTVGDVPFAVGDWCNRNGRLLTSNCTSWWMDGVTPCSIISSVTSVTCRGSAIGIALHNDGQSQNSWTPTLAFSRRSWSGIYNSTMATITAQATGCGNDTNWVAGDLVFAVTPIGGYMGENLRISANYACFNSTVCITGNTVLTSCKILVNSGTAAWGGIPGYEINTSLEAILGFKKNGSAAGYVYHNGTNMYLSNELTGVSGCIQFNNNGGVAGFFNPNNLFCVNGPLRASSGTFGNNICGSGTKLGTGAVNTGYTADGLYAAEATPNFISNPNGVQLRLGYWDNGSGLYGAAYGFDVNYRDGLNNPREYDAIVMRNEGQGTRPFRVTSYGNIYGVSKNFRIKHPIPSMNDTHHLIHTSIEGPQADLIYRGKVQLVNGKAEVNIDLASRMTDGTFELLCQDVQSYTTNESGWSLTKSYVVGNILHIEAQDETADDIISWLVIGERNDDIIKNSSITDNSGHIIVETLIPQEEI